MSISKYHSRASGRTTRGLLELMKLMSEDTHNVIYLANTTDYAFDLQKKVYDAFEALGCADYFTWKKGKVSSPTHTFTFTSFSMYDKMPYVDSRNTIVRNDHYWRQL